MAQRRPSERDDTPAGAASPLAGHEAVIACNPAAASFGAFTPSCPCGWSVTCCSGAHAIDAVYSHWRGVLNARAEGEA
jgi:hypothetical protein